MLCIACNPLKIESMTSPFRLAALAAFLVLLAHTSLAQTFTNANNFLPDEYNSGGCIGFADLDGDGFSSCEGDCDDNEPSHPVPNH